MAEHAEHAHPQHSLNRLAASATNHCLTGCLNLTVVFDHDVIDGAPATRFTRRLVELIESGYGLEETDNR